MGHPSPSKLTSHHQMAAPEDVYVYEVHWYAFLKENTFQIPSATAAVRTLQAAAFQPRKGCSETLQATPSAPERLHRALGRAPRGGCDVEHRPRATALLRRRLALPTGIGRRGRPDTRSRSGGDRHILQSASCFHQEVMHCRTDSTDASSCC